MLDGLGKVQQFVDVGKAQGARAMAITDHGNMCGHPQFYHACRKADIEPILGEEFYFTSDIAKHRELKGKSVKGEGMEAEAEAGLGRYHVVILARDARGHRILSELSSESHRNFYHKPLIDRAILEELGEDAEHLVVLSGCAGSILSKAVQSGDVARQRAEITWWRETFPHFYVELQHHDCDFDRDLNLGLVALANRYQVPTVVTNDPHYVLEEDCGHHDTLLAIQTASDIDDPNRFRFDGYGYHLRTRAEMRAAFREYGDKVWKPAVKETMNIAKLCHTRIPLWEARTWQIPKFPDVPDSYAELKRLAVQGLVEKGLRDKPEYVARVKSELAVFKETGVADFLLITRDSIQWAKSQGIPVGPGRGSVCGTLVGYLIGLHKVDSIKYKLMFERFLNPARPRMPDIDTDFGKVRRTELFTYNEEKYGIENVVHVAAYQNMKLRACFQQLAKAYGVSYPDRIRISKMFAPDDDPNDVLPLEIQEAYPDLADQLKRLQGTKRSIASHPAGLIIADPAIKIREQVPEMWIPSTKKFVGMYDLEAVEEMGLMKQDFLGVKALDVIQATVELIRLHTGEELDPDSWVPDEEPEDDKVYAMLAEGRTAGVFQLTGPANQRGCRDVMPVCFEDVVSITSLYRTGAISAGFPKIFNANRKFSKKKIPYAHPKLRPILEETWGVVLYQEQVMEFGSELAGFNMIQVDDIKEAIKHKKGELMQSMKKPFIDGCLQHSGIDRPTGAAIWKMIEGYSGYGYNRSHAVAYSLVTYQTARLKALYPIEYITALLGFEEDEEKRDTFLREAIEVGVKILPPDINVSGLSATPDWNENAIRFGLTDVKGIGPASAIKLMDGRLEGPYGSVDDVAAAVRNQGAMKALAAVGALQSLGQPCDPAEQERLLSWTFRDPMRRWRKKLARRCLFPHEVDPTEKEPQVAIAGIVYKVDVGKTKNDKQYLTWKIRWSPTESFDVRLWSESSKVWDTPIGSVVFVEGKWESKWLNLGVSTHRQVKVVHRADS